MPLSQLKHARSCCYAEQLHISFQCLFSLALYDQHSSALDSWLMSELRLLQMEALRKEVEAAALQECTFRPQLQPRGKQHHTKTGAPAGRAPSPASGAQADATLPRIPLHERLAELQKHRRCGQALQSV